MGQKPFKSGDDVTHLMTAADSTGNKPYKSGDDITHLMNQTPVEEAPPIEAAPEYTGPDTFMEGVLNSGPQVMDAMGKGAMGYLKGATVDIPSTIIDFVKNAYNHPVKTAVHTMLPGPLGDMVTGDDSMAGLRDASANVGSNPEAFGRILGQMAGQPAVTAGVMKGAGPATRMMGTPTAAIGRTMKNYQPLSGMLPGMIEPRLLRILEAAVGRGVENVGEWMRKPSPAQGEIMPPVTPEVMEGNFYDVPPPAQTALPPSNTSFYAPERNPIPPQGLPPGPDSVGLPPSAAHYTGPSDIPVPKSLPGYQNTLPPSNVHYMGNGAPPFDINASGPNVSAPTNAPKMRVNSEGNYVDLNNGNTIDQQGKVVSFPSRLSDILQKSFTEMTAEELEFLSKQNLDKNVAKTVKQELAKRKEVPRTSPIFFKNRNY